MNKTNEYDKIKLDLDESDHSDNEINSNSKNNSNLDSRFYKEQYEGVEGHMLLQLQKGFKGDKRFKIDDRFTGDFDSKVSFLENGSIYCL